jgi:large subunit ribosomal protein L10
MAKTKSQKELELKQLTKLISTTPVIGIVGIENLPASQFQQLRKKLRTELEVKVAKNVLLAKALEKVSSSKPGINGLVAYLQGQSAIIASKLKPLKLALEMEKTKMQAPAKPGQYAPEDIIVKAGETSFRPGPIVGDFQKAGIPAAIEKGKVIIRHDKTVVKKGELITEELAYALTRLEILPFTVGLELKAAYEDGILYGPESLAFNEERIRKELLGAYNKAFLLAYSIKYPTKETLRVLIQEAWNSALNLAIALNILNKATIKYLILKAYSQALALKTLAKEV